MINKRISYCLLGYLAAACLSPCGESRAADSIDDITTAWQRAYDGTARLYLQWRTEVIENESISRLEATGFSGPGLDAFAKLEGEFYRQFTSFKTPTPIDQRDPDPFRHSVFVTDGQNVLSGSWVYNDNGTRSAENFHIDGGGYAEDGSEGMRGLLFQSRQYMEDIGCPYYSGKYVTAWRRQAYREDTKVEDFLPPENFSVFGNLKDGNYTVAAEGEIEDGVACVKLERPGIDRLWLSRDHNYAVVRRDWFWGGGEHLMMTCRNSDFFQLSDSLWLPKSTERINYVDSKRHAEHEPDTVHFTVRTRLIKRQTGDRIDPDLLEVVPDKGMTILDNTRVSEDGQPLTLAYVAGQTTEETERSLEAAILRANYLADQRASRRGLWLTLAVVMVSLVCGGLIWYRRRREAA